MAKYAYTHRDFSQAVFRIKYVDSASAVSEIRAFQYQ